MSKTVCSVQQTSSPVNSLRALKPQWSGGINPLTEASRPEPEADWPATTSLHSCQCQKRSSIAGHMGGYSKCYCTALQARLGNA